MRKYRIFDISIAIITACVGVLGILLVRSSINNNFLIIVVIISLATLPLYWYSLYINKFCFSWLAQLLLLLLHANVFTPMETRSSTLMSNLIIAVEICAIILALVSTFIFSSRSQKSTVWKRILPFFREALIFFLILYNVILFSNISFDSSKPMTFEVTVTDISTPKPAPIGLGNSFLTVKYYGADPQINVSEIVVLNYVASPITVGDTITLGYCEGLFHAPYFWIPTK